MVLRVCRQVLRDSHAAEDAFQAAFLVLARKGRSFRGRDSLAPWLQQVAWRTAAHLRADVSRRRRHEQRAAATGGEVVVDRAWDDLGEALHEELGRLPARYRLALVLCYLEGLSSEQAARQLGWPAATVRSRLTRGRERLRRRLMRRGLAPSAVALAAALAPRSAWAAVRPASVSAAARAAVLVTTGRVAAGAVPASILTLTEGVILNMAMTKLKLAAVTLLVPGLLAIGAMLPAQPPGPATTQGTAGSGGPSGELPSLTALPQGTPGADPVPGVLRGEVTTQGPGGPGGRFGSNRLTRSGSQAPALSPSESDRLKAVEVKLDEILQLLKNTGARGGSAAPITSGIGTAQPLERVGAPAAAGVRRAAAPSASSSMRPPNSSGGGSVSSGLGVAAEPGASSAYSGPNFTVGAPAASSVGRADEPSTSSSSVEGHATAGVGQAAGPGISSVPANRRTRRGRSTDAAVPLDPTVSGMVDGSPGETSAALARRVAELEARLTEVERRLGGAPASPTADGPYCARPTRLHDGSGLVDEAEHRRRLPRPLLPRLA